MALQIWLPLNGDLTNYGLCQDVIITGNDSYQNSIGKIGEYALNSIDTITVQAPAFNNLTSWSVCFWANAIPSLLPNEDDDAATIIKIPSVNNHVFSPTIKAYQEQYSGETYGTYTIDGIGEATGIEYFAGWRHICLTFDGNRCYSYCDGRNWGSGWSSDNRKISAGIFELRSNNIVLKNDFRFYDHCLSEKEIKEISKALVLHYPMNNKYIEATRNLFPSTDSYSVADDLGWD